MSSHARAPAGSSPAGSPAPGTGRSASLTRGVATPTKASSAGATGSPHGVHRSSASHGMRSPAGSAAAAAAAATASDPEPSPELVAQLRERAEQLEAELKASQETAQWTIKQNKNTLLTLKQENKDLSAEVSRRGGSNELQCKQGSATDGERVVERMERHVHELRRAYDKVVKDKKTAVQRLDNLHDSLRDLHKVAAAAATAPTTPNGHPANGGPYGGGGGVGGGVSGSLASMPMPPLNASVSSTASTAAIAAAAAALPAASAAARELRQLTNRLDKATFKANEAFSIRKTYEQVLEQLRREEPLLEARIRALQEQRATKQAALATAAIAAREAAAAKEAAKAALAALEAEVAGHRARRGRVLGEMRDKAATLQQTNRALMQRQFQPLSPPDSPTPPATTAAAATGRPPAAGPPPSSSSSQRHPHPGARPGAHPGASWDASEAAEGGDITARDLVVRLCAAAGVRRVGELLPRLLAAQERHAALEGMRGAASAQRLTLAQELEVLRSHRDALRGGGKMSVQKQLDAAQAELRDAAARAEAAGEGLDATTRAYAQLRSGVEHLATMAAPLPLPAGGGGRGMPPAVPVEDETLGDVLAQVEQRLAGAYRLIVTLPKALDLLESTYAVLRDDAGPAA